MAEPLKITTLSTLHDWVGKTLPPSGWLTMTQQRINRFADATGDRQWIHCDPARAARESPYKTTIAHGYLTLALTPVLLAQIIDVKARMLVNPGVERVRLRAPVKCGARVRMHAKLNALRTMPRDGLRATFHISFEVEGESKPAASGTVLLVYYA